MRPIEGDPALAHMSIYHLDDGVAGSPEGLVGCRKEKLWVPVQVSVSDLFDECNRLPRMPCRRCIHSELPTARRRDTNRSSSVLVGRAKGVELESFDDRIHGKSAGSEVCGKLSASRVGLHTNRETRSIHQQRMRRTRAGKEKAKNSSR